MKDQTMRDQTMILTTDASSGRLEFGRARVHSCRKAENASEGSNCCLNNEMPKHNPEKIPMTRIACISLLLLTLNHLTPAQIDQPATPLTTRQVVDAWITNTETHLIPVADAMPEGKYSFAPSNGEFKDVRTFAQQLRHLAANNYRQAAVILGKRPTADQINEEGPDSVKTKAEIVNYLKGSFAALHN